MKRNEVNRMASATSAIETLNAVELRPVHVGRTVEYRSVAAGPDDLPVPITVLGTLVSVEHGQTFGRAWSCVTVEGSVTCDGVTRPTMPVIENVLGVHVTVRLYRIAEG
jgi:hypothetical protein